MTVLRSYAAIWMAVILTIAWVIVYMTADFITSKFIADFLALIGLGFVSASTTPVAYRAFVNGLTSPRDKYIFSTWLFYTLVLIHRIWITVNGILGSPDFLKYSAVSGLIAIGFAIASGYGGIAPLSIDGPLKKHEVIILVIAAGFSSLIAGIAIGVFFVSGWAN